VDLQAKLAGKKTIVYPTFQKISFLFQNTIGHTGIHQVLLVNYAHTGIHQVHIIIITQQSLVNPSSFKILRSWDEEILEQLQNHVAQNCP
jgi:hypothetical protein